MAKQRVQTELKAWRKFFEHRREVMSPDRFSALLAKWAAGDGVPAALARAGEYFGLNPSDEIESKILLLTLTTILFAKKGRKKGSKEWSALRLTLLGYRAKEIEADYPGLGDTDLARRIIKRFGKEESFGKPEYKSANVVRQQLPKARAMAISRGELNWINELTAEGLRQELEIWRAGKVNLQWSWDGNPKNAEWYAEQIHPYHINTIISEIEARLQVIEAEKQNPALTLVK